jgi:ubiquinone/menaquinone biosynthesis C-methylase UbiE
MNKSLLNICLLVIVITSLSADFDKNPIKLLITGKESLMRIGTEPHHHLENGKRVAEFMWKAINDNNNDAAKKAILLCDSLLKFESKTGDYGSLKWLSECMIASEEEKKNLILDEFSQDFFHYFSDSNYVNLKDYLLRKYKINDYTPKDPEAHLQRRTFLEDLIVFNNPRRNEWENTDEIIKQVPLKKGDRILDIGCGFGYYSNLFSKIVGENGKVYAIDTQEPYIQYINQIVKNFGIKNIIPVVSKISDISVSDTADVAFMCSVYHIIYGWSREGDRTSFLNTLKRSLKKDGYLVIADNSFYNGDELNSCYVNKELVIAQLAFHGFEFIKHVQISPQRYVLIFKHRPGNLPDFSSLKLKNGNLSFILKIPSGNSIIHIGSLDSYDITDEGVAVAKFVLDALENKNIDAARKAIQNYTDLIPSENFGGEYTALQWFCEYIAASDLQKTNMLSDPMNKAYYNYLAKDNYALLKDYIKSKYKIGTEDSTKTLTEQDREIGRTRRSFLEDFILFNNPKREDWEKSSKIMQSLKFNPGESVADVGCGSGYYSVKFSKLVGDRGKVYAIDIKEDHLNFINDYIKNQKINNIQTIKSTVNDISLNAKVDHVFMCSLYHTIYGVSSEPDRSKFIESIKKVLKKGGRLTIVDNGPVNDNTLPYHGPYITKELIIYQLAYYGFALEKYEQTIPQRYVLTFKLN